MFTAKSFIAISLLLIIHINSYSQNLTCYPGNPGAINEVRNQRVFTNLSILQTDSIKGYLEHLPADYDPADVDTKYPIVIVLHVLNENGNGTEADMCKFFANRYQLFPYTRIEVGGWPSTLPTSATDQTPFITITPQFVNQFYTHAPINGFIEYLKENYNIDESKIFLLGTSQGANVALQHVSASESNARSIAGVLALSPCYNLTPDDIQNIKTGGVSIWEIQCESDKACETPTIPLVNDTIAAYNNYNALLAAGVTNEKNVLSHLTATTGCNSNPHDTWTPALNQSFDYSTLPNPQNVYQWMGPLTSNQILPVLLSAFDVKLVNQQVWLQWETTFEDQGDLFYIERASDDMNFHKIDSVLTRNISNGAKYQYIDGSPSMGNNYYRLVQKDIDGKTQVFDIKKINIQTPLLIKIANNPFQSQINLKIQSNTADQYQLQVRDLNGKIMHHSNIQIPQGAKDFSIDGGHWPAGMYILSVQTKQGIQTYKLLKN